MLNNLINLREIVLNLFSGFSFRSKIEHTPSGNVFVVQMKDLSNDHCISKESLTCIQADNINRMHLLLHGDILFCSKGANNYACLFELDSVQTIASSAFFVLRPDEHKVVPAYLAWYINQRPVQLYLKENMAGTYITNINKSAIEKIMVALPPLDVQQRIVLIDALQKQEIRIMQTIIHKRETTVAGTLLNMALGR